MNRFAAVINKIRLFETLQNIEENIRSGNLTIADDLFAELRPDFNFSGKTPRLEYTSAQIEEIYRLKTMREKAGQLKNRNAAAAFQKLTKDQIALATRNEECPFCNSKLVELPLGYEDPAFTEKTILICQSCYDPPTLDLESIVNQIIKKNKRKLN